MYALFRIGVCLLMVTMNLAAVMAADGLQTTSSHILISNTIISNATSVHPTRLPFETITKDELDETAIENELHETTVYFDVVTTSAFENNAYTTRRENVSVQRYRFDENNYVDMISTPITTLVGIIGNTATIIALQGHPFSKIPSSYILVSLALADTSTLVSILFKKPVFVNLIGMDIRVLSRAGCKIYVFFVHCSKILSAWFVVLVCFERFVAICMPMRIKRICTKANAMKGIASAVIVTVIYSGIWTLSSEINKSKCMSTFSTPETKLRAKILIIIGSALIGILPMLILVTLTPIMCVVLYRYAVKRKQIAAAQTYDTNKVSTMLIALCVTFVLLQLPLICAHNIAASRGESLENTYYLPLVILFKVSSVLEATNYSCNFFLYIACNRIFRRKVARVCLWFRHGFSTPGTVSHTSESAMSSICDPK